MCHSSSPEMTASSAGQWIQSCESHFLCTTSNSFLPITNGKREIAGINHYFAPIKWHLWCHRFMHQPVKNHFFQCTNHIFKIDHDWCTVILCHTRLYKRVDCLTSLTFVRCLSPSALSYTHNNHADTPTYVLDITMVKWLTIEFTIDLVMVVVLLVYVVLFTYYDRYSKTDSYYHMKRIIYILVWFVVTSVITNSLRYFLSLDWFSSSWWAVMVDDSEFQELTRRMVIREVVENGTNIILNINKWN